MRVVGKCRIARGAIAVTLALLSACQQGTEETASGAESSSPNVMDSSASGGVLSGAGGQTAAGQMGDNSGNAVGAQLGGTQSNVQMQAAGGGASQASVSSPSTGSLSETSQGGAAASDQVTPQATGGAMMNAEPPQSSGGEMSGGEQQAGGSPQAPEPGADEPALTAEQLVAQWGLGWNVGNSLDVPDGETAWGNPMVSEQLLQAVAAEGFKVVRIPVTWSPHMGDAPDYTIESAWLERVDEVVGYALNAGMHAIINLHHDGADGYDGVEWLSLTDANGAVTDENNAAVEAQFVKVWEQLASYFAERDSRLLFESMNEIHDGYDAPQPAYYEIINGLNQRFVDVVRGSGGNNQTRFLVVPGYNTNIDYTLEGFAAPTDPTPNKLILSVHYYDPWSFAGEASTPTWGAQSPGADSWGQEDFVVTQFSRLQETYVSQGLPVILGEYGAVNNTGYENYRRYYMEYVTKTAADRGLVPVYWDNGGQGSGADNFGIFDRDTGAVTQPELLAAMMRAVTETYSLEEVALP